IGSSTVTRLEPGTPRLWGSRFFETSRSRRHPPPAHKSCNLARPTTHVTAVHEFTSNPSLQNARFLLQTCLLCKPGPPSRHSLALRAHRHRLSAVARKKMYVLARRAVQLRASTSSFSFAIPPNSAARAFV